MKELFANRDAAGMWSLWFLALATTYISFRYAFASRDTLVNNANKIGITNPTMARILCMFGCLVGLGLTALVSILTYQEAGHLFTYGSIGSAVFFLFLALSHFIKPKVVMNCSSKLLQLFGRSQPPTSFERWRDALPAEFLYLSAGSPDFTDADTHEKWLKSFARWKAGYKGFLEIEQHLEPHAQLMDEVDRRHHEYFVALFLQSAQWHAILLLLVEDVPEVQREEHLAEIDDVLVKLRMRIRCAANNLLNMNLRHR